MTPTDDLRKEIESTIQKVYEDWKRGAVLNANEVGQAAPYALQQIMSNLRGTSLPGESPKPWSSKTDLAISEEITLWSIEKQLKAIKTRDKKTIELTGTEHGDAANALMDFYQEKVQELRKAGQFFMAAVTLGLALETAILAYLLVEFMEDEETGQEDLKIPADVNLSGLIEAAKEIGVLNAPIDIPSHVREDNEHPKYVAEEVVEKIQKFRNLIHPANALRNSYDPRTFTREQLEEFEGMYESVLHSLMYNL